MNLLKYDTVREGLFTEWKNLERIPLSISQYFQNSWCVPFDKLSTKDYVDEDMKGPRYWTLRCIYACYRRLMNDERTGLMKAYLLFKNSSSPSSVENAFRVFEDNLWKYILTGKWNYISTAMYVHSTEQDVIKGLQDINLSELNLTSFITTENYLLEADDLESAVMYAMKTGHTKIMGDRFTTPLLKKILYKYSAIMCEQGAICEYDQILVVDNQKSKCLNTMSKYDNSTGYNVKEKKIYYKR